MHRLNGLRCYLAGPIDYAADDGVGWRNDITPWLLEKGVTVLDPCNKPIPDSYYKEIDEEKVRMMELKETGRYYELTARMKEIVHMDLRMVDISDFVIVYINPKVTMFGTIHELVNSLTQRKPTLVVIEGGRAKAPNWLFGIMDFNFMFDDFDSLQSFLTQIHRGGIMGDLSRWVFFDMED
jgi:nucleoside 2-deoxyribosyltransferase